MHTNACRNKECVVKMYTNAFCAGRQLSRVIARLGVVVVHQLLSINAQDVDGAVRATNDGDGDQEAVSRAFDQKRADLLAAQPGALCRSHAVDLGCKCIGGWRSCADVLIASRSSRNRPMGGDFKMYSRSWHGVGPKWNFGISRKSRLL